MYRYTMCLQNGWKLVPSNEHVGPQMPLCKEKDRTDNADQNVLFQ